MSDVNNKSNLNLTDEEIREIFFKKFLSFDFACNLPKKNPFAFPMWQCLKTSLCVFDKYDLNFVSTVDYLLFLKKYDIEVNLEHIELFSCTTDEYKEDYNKK